jgi:hypothetical protein
MSKIPIIQLNQSYTFSNYFEMAYEPEDIYRVPADLEELLCILIAILSP